MSGGLTCHGIITRAGEQDACGKPATSMIRDPEGDWPACGYHANRYGSGGIVPLDELFAAREAAAARRVAERIDAELVCCDGEDRHGGGICYWSSRTARIARAVAAEYEGGATDEH